MRTSKLRHLVGSRYIFALGQELYVTNGSAAGTKRFMVLPHYISPKSMFPLAGKSIVLFLAEGLWRTDGTPGGTYLINIKGAYNFIQLGRYVYFFFPMNSGVQAIWRTDGTRAGTKPVLSGKRAEDLGVTHFSAYNDELLLYSNTGNYWRLNPSTNILREVKDMKVSYTLTELPRGLILGTVGVRDIWRLGRDWKYTLVSKNRLFFNGDQSADTICR